MALDYEQLKADLVKEFDLEALLPEKRDEMIAKMTEVLMKRIFVDTMEKLGEAGMDEYERLAERGAEPSEIESFLLDRIPGYSAMVEKIIAEFKKEMKGEKE